MPVAGISLTPHMLCPEPQLPLFLSLQTLIHPSEHCHLLQRGGAFTPSWDSACAWGPAVAQRGPPGFCANILSSWAFTPAPRTGLGPERIVSLSPSLRHTVPKRWMALIGNTQLGSIPVNLSPFSPVSKACAFNPAQGNGRGSGGVILPEVPRTKTTLGSY